LACELMRPKLTVRGRYAVYMGPPAGTRSKNFSVIKAPPPSWLGIPMHSKNN